MCKAIIKYLFLLSFLNLISCSKSIDEIPCNVETINGFSTEWRKNVSEEKKNVIREILNDMIYVKGGLFLMGATQEQAIYARHNEKPAHYVQVSDYYIGKNELTVEQIEILLNTQFSSYEKKLGAPDFTWNDWAYVMKVIEEYSNVKVDFPTEAQWEYAARGGIYSKGYIYPGGNTIEEAERSENELGIADLAKGHSEWCKDAYIEYSNFPLVNDPYYIQGVGHVVRGGNIKSVTENKYYFKKFSTDDKFSICYDDFRVCRVSARSYWFDYQMPLEVSYSPWNTQISCRLVINISKE